MKQKLGLLINYRNDGFWFEKYVKIIASTIYFGHKWSCYLQFAMCRITVCPIKNSILIYRRDALLTHWPWSRQRGDRRRTDKGMSQVKTGGCAVRSTWESPVCLTDHPVHKYYNTQWTAKVSFSDFILTRVIEKD